jgi:hypothetical protein
METYRFYIILNFNDRFLYVIHSEYFDIVMFKTVPYEWSFKGLKAYQVNGSSVFMSIDAPELCLSLESNELQFIIRHLQVFPVALYGETFSD